MVGVLPTFTAAGYMRGKDAKQQQWLHAQGQYWVPQDQLLPIDVLRESGS